MQRKWQSQRREVTLAIVSDVPKVFAFTINAHVQWFRSFKPQKVFVLGNPARKGTFLGQRYVIGVGKPTLDTEVPPHRYTVT